MNNYIASCSFCEQDFSSGLEHAIHTSLYPYGGCPCQFCGITLFELNERYEHYYTFHNGPKRIKCTLDGCMTLFGTSIELEGHIVDAHLRKNKECGKCKVIFKSEAEFHEHLAIQHAKKRPTCPECSKDFACHANVARHIKTVHLDLKYFFCPTCDRGFYQESMLTTHIKRVHSVKDKLCIFCESFFRSEHQLKAHINQVHKREPVAFCEPCGLGFTRKAEMRRHVRMVHLAMSRYKCKTCKLGFHNKSRYLYHLFSDHDGQYKACHLCSSAYEHEYFLNQHLLKAHKESDNNENDFVCKICNAPFETLTELK